MMGNIKPIETHYNGYRFRSRLEAKWAVYFDKLEIKYEYEPEGYVLENGECYLPDFYLPGFNAFVEIKPKNISVIDISDAKHKMESLCISTDKFGLFCLGDPLDNDIHIYGFIESEEIGNGLMWVQAEFLIGAEVVDDFINIHKAFDVGIVVGRRNQDIEYVSYGRTDIGESTVIPFRDVFSYDRIPYEEQNMARQARFEHGECG